MLESSWSTIRAIVWVARMLPHYENPDLAVDNLILQRIGESTHRPTSYISAHFRPAFRRLTNLFNRNVDGVKKLYREH